MALYLLCYTNGRIERSTKLVDEHYEAAQEGYLQVVDLETSLILNEDNDWDEIPISKGVSQLAFEEEEEEDVDEEDSDDFDPFRSGT